MGKKDTFTNLSGLISVGERQKAELQKQAQASHEYIKKHIQINEELRSLIPPLTHIEHEKLEENILKEGCRDPLVLWQEGDNYVLIDGHNRFGICTKHELDFNFVILQFGNINQAKDWMLSNQFGKRNITEETKSYLRGMQYAREKNQVGTNQHNTNNTENPKEKKLTPLEYLATMHKVSVKTIQRDEKYFLGLNKLTGEDETFRWHILQGELPISRTKIIDWLEDEGRKDYIKDMGELGKRIKEVEEVIRREQRFDMTMLERNERKNEKTILQTPFIPNEKQLKGLAKSIKNCLRTSLEEQSLDAIAELRQYLDSFEQLIKDRPLNPKESPLTPKEETEDKE